MRKAFSMAIACGISLPGLLVRGSEIADANRLFVLEKFEDAIGIYEKVASGDNPEEAAEALFGTARAYQMLGRWKLARESFQRILREYSDSELAAASKIQLGQCEIKLGNLTKALDVFREIQEKHAGQEEAVEAVYNIANIDAGFFGGNLRNAQAAIQGYRRVLSSSLGKRYAVQSHFGLGQCYMLLRDYRKALESFRAVIEKWPDSVWASYAHNHIASALTAFGNTMPSQELMEELSSDLHRSPLDYFQVKKQFAWHLTTGRPALRIFAIGFFTERPQAGTGAVKVFYSKPTIYYKNYVFGSDRGTVDRVNRSVECTGKVRCTDDAVPPTLTVTSETLVLDLSKDKAVFSRNVSYEKRSRALPPQRMLVDELHLMLNSGTIEIPAGRRE